MKTIKQLYRQPMKTLLGIVLLTLAAAVLCVTAGQQRAADTTQELLDQRFSTVAIPLMEELLSGQAAADGAVISDELMQWMETMVREEPEVVRALSRHGLLSAYIPELTPLNLTTQPYVPENVDWERSEYYAFQNDPRTMPYSSAMLVITLEDVDVSPVVETVAREGLTEEDFLTKGEYEAWWNDPDTEKLELVKGYCAKLTGTVTEVISLAEGYRDPVGRIARLTMYLPAEADVQDLQIGAQYIVNGMNYVDEYWKLLGQVNYDGRLEHVKWEPYDPSLLRMLTDKQIEANIRRADANKKIYGDQYEYLRYAVATYNWIYLNQQELEQLNAISMTLGNALELTQYDMIRDENGILLDAIPATEVSYIAADGSTVTVSKEAYAEKYRIPTIAKLDGSAEDFLASDLGTQWQNACARAQINNHAFALVGVDKLCYLADFALEKVKLIEGRDFTQEELAGGSPVCIIYEALAQENGLAVGDTITLQLYSAQENPYQNAGTLNPSAAFYFGDGGFAETVTYTIVGICRGASAFADVSQDEYSFTANTIFVPKTSVKTEMQTSDSIVFNTLVVQNGKLEQFQELVLSSGLGGRFRTYDQGYSAIAANFHNYRALARQIMIIGLVLYGMMMVLYLLLYPASMGKTLHTMQSLGVSYGKRFFHVLLSSMAMVAVASLLGFALGNYLWDYVVQALQASTDSAMELQLERGTLECISLLQMGVALAANAAVAVIMALPKNLSSRR